MTNVTMQGVGVGDKVFDIDYAQRILDLGHPVRSWRLHDNNFTLINGKITPLAQEDKKEILDAE